MPMPRREAAYRYSYSLDAISAAQPGEKRWPVCPVEKWLAW